MNMLRKRLLWRTTQAASDNVTHGTWILAAVALGVLSVGALAIPGGPVHHWLTCNVQSIADISGSGVTSNACAPTQTVSADTTPIALLGNASLTFTQPGWSSDPLVWAGIRDTGNPSEYPYTPANAAGIYQENSPTGNLGGTVGPEVLFTYLTPDLTYQTFSYSGYSYNGNTSAEEPEMFAEIENNGVVTPSLIWSGPSESGAFTNGPANAIPLPAHTVGIAWGLVEEGTPFDSATADWNFMLTDPTLQ